MEAAEPSKNSLSSLCSLAGSAEGLTVDIGVVVALQALTLAASMPGLTVSPGAVAVVLNALTLAGSAEGLTVAAVTLSALRTWIVGAEDRTWAIGAEDRTWIIAAEDRDLEVEGG